MIVNAGNNALLTGGDRASGGPRKPERRPTALTTSTVSTCGTSSLESEVPARRAAKKPASTKKLPSSDCNNDALAKMIAKEMVASIIAGGSSASTDQRKNPLKDLDMDAINEMVRMAMQQQLSSGRTDRDEDCKNGAVVDDEEEDGDEEDYCDYNAKKHERDDSATLPTASATTWTGTSGSSAGMSDGSNASDAPMDIWNPSFWDLSVPDHNDTSSRYSGSRGPSKGSDYESGASERDEQSRGKMITEFLKDRNNEILSSDSEEDEENSSVLSDISGLTGVFEDYPSERRQKKSAPPPTGDTESILGSAYGTLATTSTASKRRKQKNKIVSYSVHFAKVEVRQYERIMTDNPSSTGGPSIGIGWDYVEQKPVHIDDYEVKRSSKRHRRMRKGDLILNRSRREKLIRSLGYSERDIAANVRELNKLRSQRRQTVNNLNAAKMEEAVESVKLQMKKMLFIQPKELSGERYEL